MPTNFFGISILLIPIIGALFLCYKYATYFGINYILGGIILLIICNVKVIGLEEDFGYIYDSFASYVNTYIFWVFTTLSVSSLISFVFKKRNNESYFFLPIALFIVISVFSMMVSIEDITPTFKLGILFRLFLAVFPLFTYSYYLKFLRKKKKTIIKPLSAVKSTTKINHPLPPIKTSQNVKRINSKNDVVNYRSS